MRAHRIWGVVLATSLIAMTSCASDGTPVTASRSDSATTDSVPEAGTAGSADVVIIRDGIITDEELAAIAPAGVPDAALAGAAIAAVMALPDDQRALLVQDLSDRYELAGAQISGLQDEIGDAAAARAAIEGAWSVVGAQIDAIDPTAPLQPATRPSGFRRGAQPPATAATVGVVGVFMAIMGMSLMAEPVVSAANSLTPDQYQESTSTGMTVSGAVEQSAVEMEFNGTQDGVAVNFNTNAVVHPCPDATGKFDIEGMLDLKTSKGAAGQNIKIEMNITGQVGDDAKLVSSETRARTQWADFGGAQAGQFVDISTTMRSDGSSSATGNRVGGKVTDAFVSMTVLLGVMYAMTVGDRLIAAAEKAWSSGRCVRLDVVPSSGPTNLQPGQTVSVLASPRSKIDGSPTGGNVTATLSAGGQSVEPNGSPVPADADSTYTAPNEPNKTGTVGYESRSKRGVGKAQLGFSTAAPASYQISGGLDDFQVDQVVCDIMQSFVLSGGGFTATYSGGLAGTYSYVGPFDASGGGSYSISLPADPTQPGAMTSGGEGQVVTPLGVFSASGVETFTLVPVAPCG
jgi:hypothetical protein